MYLYGAGGHAKVILDILETQNVEAEGIIDDSKEGEFMGVRILRGWQKYCSPIIISIGNNDVRRKIAERLTHESVAFGTAVHPSAVVSHHAEIGEGSVIMQGSVIQSCAHIGRHCIVNTCASVDHDCVIGDYAHISPHATLCGNVSVGEGSWVGAGSVVIPGVKIGRWSVVGAGSVVCRDIPDGVVAYGSPCRVIRKIKE